MSLLVYASYLFFQFFSHKSLYQDDSEEVVGSKKYSENPFKFKRFQRGKQPTKPKNFERLLIDSPLVDLCAEEDGTAPPAQPASDPETNVAQVEEETEEPQMSVSISLGLLVVVTVVSPPVIRPRHGKGDHR